MNCFELSEHKVFLGVCGGLGEFFGINRWLMRFLFLFVFLPFTVIIPGILLYFHLYVKMKQQGEMFDKKKIDIN